MLGSGAWAAASALGFSASGGPLADASVPVALLVGGAGAGVCLSAWERRAHRRMVHEALSSARRAAAQRDAALLQARRLRAQAEGLALMREIHRATAIAARHERLRRILTLLAELFDAREVCLFTAGNPCPSGVAGNPAGVQPAAWLRITKKEELFAAFGGEEPGRAAGAARPVSEAADGASAALRVAQSTAAIVREGCQLLVEGVLERGGVPVAKAQWRRGVNAEHDPLLEFGAAEILTAAVAKLDYGPAALALAVQALERRRPVRVNGWCGADGNGSGDRLVLCAPLLAEQRPVGVLYVRRSGEGCRGSEIEALEELLVESAKHVALALKKDEDDRKAITDGLTGLYIKRHFLVTLEQMRAEAAMTGTPFCLIMCDLDHFKRVNDTHGHLTGDLVLKGVAAMLRKGLRAGDMAFRYGGEELALLLPNSALQTAARTAERCSAAVQAAPFRGDKGQPVPVTLSLGIAEYEQGLTAEAFIARADKALYACKEGGRNRVMCWPLAVPHGRDARGTAGAAFPSSFLPLPCPDSLKR